MNAIFLFIAAFLLLLGMYPFSKTRNLLTIVFMIENISLAVWNLSYYLQRQNLYFLDVNLVSQIQLEAVMIFANGVYLLSNLYPVYSRRLNYYLILPVFAGFTYAIFFTGFVSHASLVDGELVFDDGWGYALFCLYLIGLGALSLRNLYRNYKHNEESRISILLVSFGISVFAVFGFIFALFLPMMGNFNYLGFATLGAVFPLCCYAYSITKHDFLDISVIINKNAAWALTIIIISVSFFLSYYSTVNNHHVLGLFSTLAVGIFWSFYAVPFHQFLLTTAKRKFIRGWYDTEEVLTQLSDKVTSEKNRQAIFLTIEKVLDNVMELEKTNIVVAVRDQDEQLSHYQYTGNGELISPLQLSTGHPLVGGFSPERPLRYLEDCDDQTRAFLQKQDYKDSRRCLVIAFFSPETLEGLVILGERSNQAAFDSEDLRFFRRLVNYMSAILYRLTPMEKLEKSYFENVQRLHEAEIQLVRAQKIESIVHATRQCHHEIRTPLNIIRLGIGRVKDLDGLQAYKKLAEEEISHALEIVEETLTITDVEKPSPDRVAIFNLNDAIQRSLKLIAQDRYKVQTALTEDIRIRGIFSDIQVVFANLIHNAQDAMPDGGRITIQSKVIDGLAVIEFSDTGSGIDEDLRERVWEPYFSGHETVVGNSTAGRGWGLTIVNRIISEHKGVIHFSSVINEGTTFVIKLPLADTGDGETSAREQARDEDTVIRNRISVR